MLRAADAGGLPSATAGDSDPSPALRTLAAIREMQCLLDELARGAHELDELAEREIR